MSRWPKEIRLKKGRQTLEVSFDDGLSALLSAELLRVLSPSAEVQGHGAGKAKLIGGKRGVGIRSIERVGTYAVRLIFDDGHSTGFYTWAYLEDMALTHEEKFKAYETDLAAAGMSRDA